MVKRVYDFSRRQSEPPVANNTQEEMRKLYKKTRKGKSRRKRSRNNWCTTTRTMLEDLGLQQDWEAWTPEALGTQADWSAKVSAAIQKKEQERWLRRMQDKPALNPWYNIRDSRRSSRWSNT